MSTKLKPPPKKGGSGVPPLISVSPDPWRSVKLGSIAVKIGSGSTPRGGQAVYKQSGIPLIRSMNVHFSGFKPNGLAFIDEQEGDKLRHVTVEPQDVLLNITGASIGRVTIAPKEMVNARVNQHVCIIRPYPELYSPFLAYFLSSPDEQARIMNVQVGATRQALTKSMIENWDVPLPPLDVQRRIVAEIEKQFTRLEAGVAALKRAQANLKRYRAALLKAACEGRLVPTEAELARQQNRPYESGQQLLTRILTDRRKNWQGRGKYKEPAVPNADSLLSLPDGWTWLSVDAIGFITKLAGFEYTKYVKYSEDGDLAVIKAENAGRSGFKRTEISRIKSSTVLHLTRSQLKAGDVLMVFVGAGTGNVARVPDDQPYFLGPNIAMIRVNSLNVSAPYLEMFLRSPVGHSLTFSFIKAVAQPSLSMGTIRMIPVALPPLAEQTRIVAEVERRLSVVEELELTVTATLRRANRLRQSVLSHAFEG